MNGYTLRDPFGVVVSPSEAETDPPTQTYDIPFPTPGVYTVTIDATSIPSGLTSYSLLASNESELTFAPSTADGFLLGENAKLACVFGMIDSVSGSFTAMTGATIGATIVEPNGIVDVLTLFDDGLHNDGAADDGQYANTFSGTMLSGDHSIEYRAEGTTPGGLVFRRVAIGSFTVSSNIGRIAGQLADSPVDYDADGLTDYVRLEYWVTVDLPGDYIVAGRLLEENSSVTLAASNLLVDLPAGTSSVSLYFDRRAISTPGTYGPFSLEYLELSEQQADRVAWLDQWRSPYVVNTTLTVPPAPETLLKNRYISFAPDSGVAPAAYRVTMTGSLNFPGSVGASWWVDAPNDSGNSKLVGAPVYRVWPEEVIHVGDCEVVPVATYEISRTSDGTTFTPPRTLMTILQPSLNGKKWGDVAGINNGTAWTPPNQFTNVNDILAVLAYISSAAVKPEFQRANLQAISSADPCLNAFVNTADVLILVKAVAGDAYPFTTNPTSCPVCP